MNNQSWPPPPTDVHPAGFPGSVAAPKLPVWKRYGLLFGLAANLAIAIVCVHFFFLPYGSTLPNDDGAFIFTFGVSVIAISVGSALSLWGMGSQRQRRGSITLDLVGLVLNWLPYPLMLFLVHEAVTLQRLWDGG